MEHVDVAVVGGGPGGTAAARAAAAGGADTVLFEKGVPREDRDGLGADSTDAAGMLDYWVDIMGIPFEELPDELILREFDRSEFIGPEETLSIGVTGIEASYDGFGFAFDRRKFDDWMHERAEAAGASIRVGTSVTQVDSTAEAGGYTHTLSLADGETLAADALVLADGPQRQVSLETVEQFLPAGSDALNCLSPPTANHIAYQEHRRIPEELFDPAAIKFYWGWMPGETAYPWIFPNDGNIARVGLTMPIGMDLDSVPNPESYRLLDPEDDQLPSGSEYIERLLDTLYGDEYDVETDFPLVETRGKRNGTETYPISSTRPIDSPVEADIAVVGGAMGTTSAFHEGGTHVAVGSGRVAGTLAAEGRLEAYNDGWKEVIGGELHRNVALADMVSEYEPADWDRAFGAVEEMLSQQSDGWNVTRRLAMSAAGGLKLYTGYKRAKFRHRNGSYVQLAESEYVYKK